MWQTVSLDPSGTIATKKGGDDTFGYVQAKQVIFRGAHTW